MIRMNKWRCIPILYFAFAVGAVGAGEINAQAAKATPSKPTFNAFMRTELFFGMDKPTGGAVSEEEWQKFVADVVTTRFPDGLTIDDALGQYLDGKTLVREKNKQLILIYPRRTRSFASRKIEEIRSAYIKAFDQKSVLRVDLPYSVLVSF